MEYSQAADLYDVQVLVVPSGKAWRVVVRVHHRVQESVQTFQQVYWTRTKALRAAQRITRLFIDLKVDVEAGIQGELVERYPAHPIEPQ